MRPPSKRAENVNPFIVMKVAAAAALLETQSASLPPSAHRKVLHLEIGQPSTQAPHTVALAAIKSLADADASAGYTGALGMPELRAAIANLYLRRHGVQLDGSDVAVTSGSSGAFVAVFTACLDAGDRVAVCVPGYPCYRNVLQVLRDAESR